MRRRRFQRIFATSQLLLLCLAATTTACSSSMKYSVSQSDIHDNPRPQQKYEVIVTSDAPGPWDSVEASVLYTVTNDECVPLTPIEGARLTPDTLRTFKVTSSDGGKTWIGYFYRDAIEDADYFGRGVCHWDVESVGPSFTVHGENFGPDADLSEMLTAKTYTTNFLKAQYFDKAITDNLPATGRRMNDAEAVAEVARDPGAFFPMTITVKEVKQ